MKREQTAALRKAAIAEKSFTVGGAEARTVAELIAAGFLEGSELRDGYGEVLEVRVRGITLQGRNALSEWHATLRQIALTALNAAISALVALAVSRLAK